MNTLQENLDDYLAMRRSLGVMLQSAGRLLQGFVNFTVGEGATFITTELALRWATQPKNAQPAQWANRLNIVRRFAQYCRLFDPHTEVPPEGLLPYRYQRPAPYIYSDKEIKQLIHAAKQLEGITGLRPYTYITLFGLYAVTGMRTEEPLNLDRNDVDLTQGTLCLRGTKFGKMRYLPIHISTQSALQRYAERRDRLCSNPQSSSFFISENGARLSQCTVRWTFIKLSHQIGLRKPTDSHGPRILDFRHRFAVSTLIRWYRSGVDIDRYLPVLATYLGHEHITDTYWYITATPELMQLASERMEHAVRGGKPW